MKIFRRFKVFIFLKNCWKFRKQLSDFYAMDYAESIGLFKKGLEEMLANCKGSYWFACSDEMIKEIPKVLRILRRIENDRYFEIIEWLEKRYNLVNFEDFINKFGMNYLEFETHLLYKDLCKIFKEDIAKKMIGWWI